MTPWAGLSLVGVAATGDLTQLYPASCTVGSGATTMGTLVRQPCEGVVVSCQLEPDGTNGGDIEIWDINGGEVGANVNTAAAITDAQLTTAIAAGRARLLYSQKFTGSAGSRLTIAHGCPFVHGLAARYINAGAGGPTCQLNLIVAGGCRKTEICG